MSYVQADLIKATNFWRVTQELWGLLSKLKLKTRWNFAKLFGYYR